MQGLDLGTDHAAIPRTISETTTDQPANRAEPADREQGHDDRPDEVELFFDRQRPEVPRKNVRRDPEIRSPVAQMDQNLQASPAGGFVRYRPMRKT